MVLSQDHVQSCKTSKDSRLPVSGQWSASLILGAWLSHLTCNQNYSWSIWQPNVEPFRAGVCFFWCGDPRQRLHTPAWGVQVCYRQSLWFYGGGGGGGVVSVVFLLINPRVMLALAVMLSMWEFQDRPLDMSTPSILHWWQPLGHGHVICMENVLIS